MSGHWQRFRPENNEAFSGTPVSSLELFAKVLLRLKKVDISKRSWRKYQDFTELDSYIDGARGHAVGLEKENAPSLVRAEAWLYALALQAPRAAVAQEQMDKHPHGYHNKEHRLYELIDFNDAFDSAILALPHELLPHVKERVRDICDFMCKKVGTRCFADEEYEAIVHGLSREIAVYIGLAEEGYHVEMTSRREDALGIDMTILDPKTMKEVAVDIKTRSSYHYRVQELHREGRLSEEGLLMAERNGFTEVRNGRGHEGRRVVTWRIDHEVLGEVIDFRFEDTHMLAEEAQMILLRYGKNG